MVSKVDIVNSALIYLGDEINISAIGEDGRAGESSEIIYDIVKDGLLSSHPWNFAIGRSQLQLNTASPAFEYDNSFALPADCLRAWQLYNYQGRWKVEGQNLLTDTSPANLIYIKKVEDPNSFSELFVEALILHLAARLSTTIGKSASISANLFKQAKDMTKEAKRRDGQEGSPDSLIATTFIDGIKTPTGYLRDR